MAGMCCVGTAPSLDHALSNTLFLPSLPAPTTLPHAVTEEGCSPVEHEQQFLASLPFLLPLWIVIRNIFILTFINTGNPNQQSTNRNTRNYCLNLITFSQTLPQTLPRPLPQSTTDRTTVDQQLPRTARHSADIKIIHWSKPHQIYQWVNAYDTRLIFLKSCRDQPGKWAKFIFSTLRAPVMW